MIKVLLADDHRMVRAGFRRLLDDKPDMIVVGEAGSANEVLDFVRSQAVDLVLLDISMPPGVTGLAILPMLKRAAPGLRVLVVSMNIDGATAARAMAAGANGYLSKASASHELISAIREMCAGL